MVQYIQNLSKCVNECHNKCYKECYDKYYHDYHRYQLDQCIEECADFSRKISPSHSQEVTLSEKLVDNPLDDYWL